MPIFLPRHCSKTAGSKQSFPPQQEACQSCPMLARPDPLMEHQIRGVQWMIRREQERCGGALCDKPGLGKTIQALKLVEEQIIEQRQQQKAKSMGGTLVVCPEHLVGHWVDEIKKHNFALQWHVYSGEILASSPSKKDIWKDNVYRLYCEYSKIGPKAGVAAERNENAGEGHSNAQRTGEFELHNTLVHALLKERQSYVAVNTEAAKRRKDSEKAARERREKVTRMKDLLQQHFHNAKALLCQQDIVVVDYTTLLHDFTMYREAHFEEKNGEIPLRGPLRHVVWNRVIVDEPHRLHSRGAVCVEWASHRAQSVSSLQSTYRWLLTATYQARGAKDNFSLLDFLHIGIEGWDGASVGPVKLTQLDCRF